MLFDDDLKLASYILLSRLSRPGSINVSIIPHPICPSTDLFNKELGRLVGTFGIRPDGNPTFYMAVRDLDEADYKYVYVYYLNGHYDKVQNEELTQIKHFFPNIRRADDQTRLGVINVITLANPLTYLSSFIEAIDHSVSPKLYDEFIESQIIRIGLGSKLAKGDPTQSFDECEGTMTNDMRTKFKKFVDSMAERYKNYSDQVPLDIGAFTISHECHQIGIIINRASKIVNYILMHRRQIGSLYEYITLQKEISREFKLGDDYDHYCTRYFADTKETCNDEQSLEVWRLLLDFQPNLLTYTHESEIRWLATNYWSTDEYWLNKEPSHCVPLCISPRRLYYGDENVECQSQTELIFEGKCSHPVPIVLAPLDVPSQETNYDSWKLAITSWKEVTSDRRRIKDTMNPPIHKLEPFNDYTQSYLADLPSYESGLKLMTRVWNMFSPTAIYNILSKPDDKGEDHFSGAQFVICPIRDYKLDDSIVIIDRAMNRWIYMKPDNNAYNNREQFNDGLVGYLIWLIPELKDIEGEPIIMTSNYHSKYPRVHLLMGLYIISRLFRYGRMLPKKVIYGEWEFRNYANNICTELQVTNAEYNQDNNLIDEYGYLMRGAKHSLVSPIRFARCIVPKDQCMFCKKRYAKNLGRHMSMAHGGQSDYANRSKLN